MHELISVSHLLYIETTDFDWQPAPLTVQHSLSTEFTTTYFMFFIMLFIMCMSLFTVTSPQHNCMSHHFECFLFTTGKPLTSSSAYRAVLHCSNWHQLGILLNVDHKTLEEISLSKREGPSACKAAMLDAWLKGNANASWRQLADALKVMGNHTISQAVEKEYC